MGTLSGWLGIALGMMTPISRGLANVVFYSALNRRVTAEFRATINSVVSLGTRALFIVCGPLLGMIIDEFGVQICLLVLAAIFVPLYTLVLVGLSGKIQQDQADSKPLVA